jgi:hypothetical protein
MCFTSYMASVFLTWDFTLHIIFDIFCVCFYACQYYVWHICDLPLIYTVLTLLLVNDARWQKAAFCLHDLYDKKEILTQMSLNMTWENQIFAAGKG